MRATFRITSDGKVAIPQELLDQLGIKPDSDVEMEIIGNAITIRKSHRILFRGSALNEWISAGHTARLAPVKL